MVAFFNIFQMLQISVQLLFGCKSSSINSLKLRLARITSPVSHRGGDKLECLNRFCTHQMRTRAEIGEIAALPVE